MNRDVILSELKRIKYCVSHINNPRDEKILIDLWSEEPEDYKSEYYDYYLKQKKKDIKNLEKEYPVKVGIVKDIVSIIILSIIAIAIVGGPAIIYINTKDFTFLLIGIFIALVLIVFIIMAIKDIVTINKEYQKELEEYNQRLAQEKITETEAEFCERRVKESKETNKKTRYEHSAKGITERCKHDLPDSISKINLPQKFVNEHDLDALIKVLEEGRVDDLSEAINMAFPYKPE